MYNDYSLEIKAVKDCDDNAMYIKGTTCDAHSLIY